MIITYDPHFYSPETKRASASPKKNRFPPLKYNIVTLRKVLDSHQDINFRKCYPVERNHEYKPFLFSLKGGGGLVLLGRFDPAAWMNEIFCFSVVSGDRLVLWIGGIVDIWCCGYVVLWICGVVSIWCRGYVVLWGIWRFGYAVWASGVVDRWYCGHLVLWISGVVDIWCCGHLVL